MIDIDKEVVILLTEAAGEIPGRPHISTVIRWTKRGIRGVLLETALIGGRRFTSKEAIDRFLNRLNQQPTTNPANNREAELDRVDRQLDAEGLGA